MKPEELFSRQVAQFLNHVLPENAYANLFPAGGGGYRRGAALAGMGLTSGFPDWLVIWRGQIFTLELKSAKGIVSAAQKDCHKALIRAGCKVAIVRDITEVETALRLWEIPICGTTGQGRFL